MILCFATGSDGVQYTKTRLAKIFKGAEVSFLFGVLFLFVTVSMVFFASTYPKF